MAESKQIARGETPVLDARLLGLPGPAKLRALQAGLGLTNGDICVGTRSHPQQIAQTLSGGRRNEATRNALSAKLRVPREEVDNALDTESHVPAVA